MKVLCTFIFILGVQNVHADHAASHIGRSLGLVTVLRATPFHASKSCIYLPLELLLKVCIVTIFGCIISRPCQTFIKQTPMIKCESGCLKHMLHNILSFYLFFLMRNKEMIF